MILKVMNLFSVIYFNIIFSHFLVHKSMHVLRFLGHAVPSPNHEPNTNYRYPKSINLKKKKKKRCDVLLPAPTDTHTSGFRPVRTDFVFTRSKLFSPVSAIAFGVFEEFDVFGQFVFRRKYD